jgi:hypothetical protein
MLLWLGEAPVGQLSTMKRLTAAALVAVVAACSSPSGPQNGYTGTWKAVTENGFVTTTTTQNDSVVTGTGAFVSGKSRTTFRVSGTSFRPNLNFTMLFDEGGAATFSGTYVTGDSVAGVLETAPSIGGESLALKRH